MTGYTGRGQFEGLCYVISNTSVLHIGLWRAVATLLSNNFIYVQHVVSNTYTYK